MDAPQNSFPQLSLTFSGASAISFSRINPGRWSTFESLRSIDLAHRFPFLNRISAPRFPHQWFPIVHLHLAFSLLLIWNKMWIAGCGNVTFPQIISLISTKSFLQAPFHKLLSASSFPQAPFHKLLSTIFILHRRYFTESFLTFDIPDCGLQTMSS